MIKLYPVLVANSVSKNIIPGICKAIERFALIYKLDQLAVQSRKNLNVSLRTIGRKVQIKEETDDLLINYLTNEILFEQGTYPGPYNPAARFGQGSKKRGEFSYVGSSGEGGPDQRTYNISASKSKSKSKAAAAAQAQGGSAFVNVVVPPPQKPTPKTPEEERELAKQKEIGKREGEAADATIAIGQMDMKSLMLEPTWMKVDVIAKTGMKYTTILGVKAVPALVKSDAQLAQLISFDKQVGRLMHLVLNFGRYVSGILYRLYARTLERVFDPDPRAISGNPYKDIVLKRTILYQSHVKDVFLVLNQADLEEDFAISAKGIRKLMRLGWQSFCIADDVNRRLTFCMSEFQGMCQTVPYTMIYHTLDQARIFEDLEDVRRSTTSLFKSKIPLKKVFGESLAQKKLEEYSVDLFKEPSFETELLTEIAYIDESFAGVMKKVVTAPKEFITRLFKGTIQVPEFSFEKVLKIGKKTDPQFIKAHAFAKRVLINSLNLKNINDKIINWAAYAVIIKAKTMPGKDLLVKTKDALLAVVPIFRKIIRKAKATTLNIPPEHRIEAAIGLTSLFILVVALAYFYVLTVITTLKVKPIVGDIIGILTKYFTLAIISIKGWILSGAKAVEQADVVTGSQRELVGSYWMKLYKDSLIELKSMWTEVKTAFADKLGQSSQTLPPGMEGPPTPATGLASKLDEMGLNLNSDEVIALILLTVVGILGLKYIFKQK